MTTYGEVSAAFATYGDVPGITYGDAPGALTVAARAPYTGRVQIVAPTGGRVRLPAGQLAGTVRITRAGSIVNVEEP